MKKLCLGLEKLSKLRFLNIDLRGETKMSIGRREEKKPDN